MEQPISDTDIAKVTQLLGRAPRGMEAIQIYNEYAEPSVIRVASLVEGKPFPTLFWLVDKHISYQLDKLEANGVIYQLQQQIDASKTLQQSLIADHKNYIALREKYMRSEIKKALQAGGYYESLQKRGVGGIANFTRIRCLHTYYAAHLVNKNTVGRLIDKLEM